jgi:hypothetical protein
MVVFNGCTYEKASDALSPASYAWALTVLSNARAERRAAMMEDGLLGECLEFPIVALPGPYIVRRNILQALLPDSTSRQLDMFMNLDHCE